MITGTRKSISMLDFRSKLQCARTRSNGQCEVTTSVHYVRVTCYYWGRTSLVTDQWASYQIRKIASFACAGNAGGVFPRHPGSAIPTCITARAARACRGACRDRLLAVSFEVDGGGNVPGILGACATRNFAYLVRGPCLPTPRFCFEA